MEVFELKDSRNPESASVFIVAESLKQVAEEGKKTINNFHISLESFPESTHTYNIRILYV
jgi:hypothetical protein